MTLSHTWGLPLSHCVPCVDDELPFFSEDSVTAFCVTWGWLGENQACANILKL